mmetsp:Transcript_7389/g.11019  ORF Transcript_7389/g.11019 Transcript_7389/m.11019 type:complete len:337 (-) Transcript_7389:77-1087(-)
MNSQNIIYLLFIALVFSSLGILIFFLLGSKSSSNVMIVTIDLEQELSLPSLKMSPKYELSEHFSRILMVVFMSWSPPDTILLAHDRLWRATFKHIVYYGPFNKDLVSEMKNRGIICIFRSDYDVKPEGTLGYRALMDAMHRFSHFDGYLFRHDDFYVNLVAMSRWNLSMIWSTSGNFLYPIENFTDISKGTNWWWKHPRAGYTAVKNILEGNETIGKILTDCTGRNDTWFVGGATSDFVYIPSSAVPAFQNIVGYFSFHELFLEVAIPTFTHCFMNLLVLHVPLCNLWGNKRNNNATYAREQCNNGSAAIHPIKLSRGRKFLDLAYDFMWNNSLVD